MSGLRSRLHEERGIIRALFVRTILAFVVLGLIMFETGQIVWAGIQAGNAAEEAAKSAAEVFDGTGNAARAREAAEAAAQEQAGDARILRFEIDAREGTVTVEVEVVADTAVVHHLSFTRDLGIRHATATAEPIV